MTPDTIHFPLGDPETAWPFDYSGERAVIRERFEFVDGDERVVVLPGFVTDFNSIPRPLWPWFPPTEYPAAGIVHDWLYQHPGGRSRGDCDRIHRRILEIYGCRKSKRSMAYAGLRMGGWLPWRRYRKAEATVTVA